MKNWIDFILGRRLATSEKDLAQIGVLSGVPAMGLDGLSSAAYGPEAALTLLVPLGAAGLHWIGPITLVIVILLGLLYTSYLQTITAYPKGGGSYTVAGENLGVWPGLLAAAALMVDYLLNVAVGISAGVAALVSAAPSLHHFTLPLCMGVLLFITLLNLRGTGEAGLAFALPTYVFIAALVCIIGVGVMRTISSGGHPHPVFAPPPVAPATAGVSLWLLLRAFASGCTAMTGVEAVSNGVGAFKEPTVQRAHRTLTIIIVTLAILLGGVAYLANAYHIDAMDQSKPGYQSILSQLLAAVVGRGWVYKIAIGSVLAVLCLSANTSFVDFPRLCRLIAQNDYLPRAFAVSGRRLVYSVGVIFLAVAAAALLFAFDGITDRLIPLFAVGAFLAFTLSQAGMVVHWRRQFKQGHGKAGATFRLVINAAGACATACALAIILSAKFVEGAWIVTSIVPLQLIVFAFVHHHYEKFNRQTVAPATINFRDNKRPIVLVPTRGPDRLTEKALLFAMWLSDEVCALHLSNLSGEEAKEEDRKVRQGWEDRVVKPARESGVPLPRLEVVQTPYRSYLEPVLAKIDQLKVSHPDRTVAVVLPEVVASHWWQMLLHSRKSRRLRTALFKRCDHHVVVVEVPWYLTED